jgi:hypothetical protein
MQVSTRACNSGRRGVPSKMPMRQGGPLGLSNDEPFGVEQSVVARWEEREQR